MIVPHLSDLAGAAGFALVALWPWLSGRRALLAGQGALTWAGWPSACAAAGMILATVARWCRSALLLRVLFLAAGVCWVAHDLLTGSTFGLAADLLCMAGLVYGALRGCVPRKRDEAALPESLPTSQGPTPGLPSVEPR